MDRQHRLYTCYGDPPMSAEVQVGEIGQFEFIYGTPEERDENSTNDSNGRCRHGNRRVDSTGISDTGRVRRRRLLPVPTRRMVW